MPIDKTAARFFTSSFLLSIFLFATQVSANQYFVLKGKIVNANGTYNPLVKIRTGQNVSDSIITSTDQNGEFRIVLPASEPKEIAISDGKTIVEVISLLTDADDSATVTMRLGIPGRNHFQFSTPSSRTARYAHIHLEWEMKRERFVDSMQALQKNGSDIKPYAKAWQDTADGLKKLVITEHDPIIRGEYLLQYCMNTMYGFMKLDTAFFLKYVPQIPAESPLWFFNKFIAFSQSLLWPGGRALRDSIMIKNPNRELKAYLLFEGAMEAQRNMDEVGLRSNYELLKDEYPDIWYTKIVDRWIMVNIKIKRGASIPPFAFKDMDDSTVTYTHSSLKGKIYLLDFWATWCLACIGEIPYLQKAYDKYHSKGLEIISISSDMKRSDVTAFRTQKVLMPWRHVWISEGEKKIVHDQFEVTGIPKPILVDQDGTIIGLKAGVRGEKLENTLAKVFKKE